MNIFSTSRLLIDDQSVLQNRWSTMKFWPIPETSTEYTAKSAKTDQTTEAQTNSNLRWVQVQFSRKCLPRSNQSTYVASVSPGSGVHQLFPIKISLWGTLVTSVPSLSMLSLVLSPSQFPQIPLALAAAVLPVTILTVRLPSNRTFVPHRFVNTVYFPCRIIV